MEEANTKNDSSGVWFNRRYVDLVGDINAALMLSQIHYWFSPDQYGKSKLRVIRDGKFWLAKSAVEWKCELGLTAKQARRSIDLLKSQGLIETRIMKFYGHPTTHITLTDMGHHALRLPVSPAIDLPSKTKSFVPEDKSLTETTTKNTTKSTPAGKPAMDVQPESNSKGYEKEESSTLSIGDKKCESSLGKFWRACVGKKYPGYQKPLTKKDCGQLKQLKKKLEIAFNEVVSFAIGNWSEFCWEAKYMGVTSSPSVPHIGFLLAHFDAAVQLMETKTLQQKNLQIAQAQFQISNSMPTSEKLEEPNGAIADPPEGPMGFTNEQMQANLAKFLLSLQCHKEFDLEYPPSATS